MVEPEGSRDTYRGSHGRLLVTVCALEALKFVREDHIDVSVRTVALLCNDEFSLTI
jgi:hypothetical protein